MKVLILCTAAYYYTLHICIIYVMYIYLGGCFVFRMYLLRIILCTNINIQNMTLWELSCSHSKCKYIQQGSNSKFILIRNYLFKKPYFFCFPRITLTTRFDKLENFYSEKFICASGQYCGQCCSYCRFNNSRYVPLLDRIRRIRSIRTEMILSILIQILKWTKQV